MIVAADPVLSLTLLGVALLVLLYVLLRERRLRQLGRSLTAEHEQRAVLAGRLDAISDVVDAARTVDTAQRRQRDRQRTADLADELARQAELVARVAHDLKAPLAAIAGYAELLGRSERLAPELRCGALDAIIAQTRRLERLGDDLLAAATARAGVPLRRQRVDLTAVLTETRDLALGLVAADPADRRRVELMGAERAGTVVGDDSALRRVFANLVANAVTHTPAGTPVTVAVERAAATVEVRVSDRGGGMAPGVPVARTGLGLDVVRTLVAASGGDVTVESDPGTGTTVTVVLPKGDVPPTGDGLSAGDAEPREEDQDGR